MTALTIDGKRVEVEEGTTVLAAAERLGIHVPRFCYHKCLPVVGSCRLCFVEIEGAKNPVISCKEPAKDGMVVWTNSELARNARADTLEFLLKNHPLDCPVCDQSGECDLQDYYFEHSLRRSRLCDPKVSKVKASRIGPQVFLDAERCVLCTRCVRFCDEIAGVHEIGVFERGEVTTIGVLPGKELSNPYSLMTVDLCPVGALTSADFRFKKRVWFLKKSPSVCVGCSTVCSVWIDHEGGTPYRVRPRENHKVNGCLMCDEGRMTYKRALPEGRVLSPMIKRGGEWTEVGWPEATGFVAGLLKSGSASEVVGVLSAVSSNEDNEAMASLFNSIGAGRIFYSGRDPDPSFKDGIIRDSDRNPNSAGVARFANKRLSDLRRGAGYIVLDEACEADLAAVRNSDPAWVLSIAASSDGLLESADALLPKCSWLETGGTYVNRMGVEQRALGVFAPKGASMEAAEIARLILEACG